MILQIETATTSCSVALQHQGQLLGHKLLNQRNVHAEVITLFIDELMNAAGVKYADLDVVAVSCGPGSYTGLRIGVSTAKGLCYGSDKPLIAVETLAAMASGYLQSLAGNFTDNTLLCPMIDARRMEVFTAVFDVSGNKVMPTNALIVDENSFNYLLANHKIHFFGDGAGKCSGIINHPNAIIIDDFVNDAAHLTQIAQLKYAAQQFEDVAYFEPYYLKDFIAGKKAV